MASCAKGSAAKAVRYEYFTLYIDTELDVDTSMFSNFLATAIRSLLGTGSLYYKGQRLIPSCIDQFSGKRLEPHDMLNLNGTLYRIIDLTRGRVK